MRVTVAILAATAVAVALAVGARGAAQRAKPTGCTHWAAPGGNDAGPGSESEPYGTVAHLLLTLRPGKRGCLAPGAVFTEHVVVSGSGAKKAPIILMSTPNRQGAVLGAGIEFGPSVHDVLIEHVAVRTTATAQLPALVVLRGLRNGIEDSNVQGVGAAPGNEACVLLDHANQAIVDHNAIEQCGQLANAQGYVPGIFDSVSAGARITDNKISRNPSDGIALSPDAQLTLVSRNLIINNGAGVFFGGGTKFASSDNRVVHNVIANSSTYNVHASYSPGAPTGRNNLVAQNCITAAGQGNVAGMLPGGRGFKTVGNVAAGQTAKACRKNLPSAATAPAAQTLPVTKRVTRLVSAHGIELTSAAAVAGNKIKLINLVVHGAARGSTVTIVCLSGCSLKDVVTVGGSGTATSKGFAGQTLPKGAVLEAKAVKSGYVGAWGDFVVKPNVAAGLVFHIQATGCLHGLSKIACPKAGK